jgi:hypothetical protein
MSGVEAVMDKQNRDELRFIENTYRTQFQSDNTEFEFDVSFSLFDVDEFLSKATRTAALELPPYYRHSEKVNYPPLSLRLQPRRFMIYITRSG